jgi:hypothetical protein
LTCRACTREEKEKKEDEESEGGQSIVLIALACFLSVSTFDSSPVFFSRSYSLSLSLSPSSEELVTYPFTSHERTSIDIYAIK